MHTLLFIQLYFFLLFAFSKPLPKRHARKCSTRDFDKSKRIDKLHESVQSTNNSLIIIETRKISYTFNRQTRRHTHTHPNPLACYPKIILRTHSTEIPSKNPRKSKTTKFRLCANPFPVRNNINRLYNQSTLQ